MGPDICCLRFVCSRVHIRQVPSSKPSVIYLIPYRVRKFIFPTRDDTDVRWAQIPPLPPSPPTVRFRFETFNRQSLLSIGSWQMNLLSSTKNEVTLANEINDMEIVNDGGFHVIYFVGERHLVVELKRFICQDPIESQDWRLNASKRKRTVGGEGGGGICAHLSIITRKMGTDLVRSRVHWRKINRLIACPKIMR